MKIAGYGFGIVAFLCLAILCGMKDSGSFFRQAIIAIILVAIFAVGLVSSYLFLTASKRREEEEGRILIGRPIRKK